MFVSRRSCLAQALAREQIHLQDLTADVGALLNTGTEHRALKMFNQFNHYFEKLIRENSLFLPALTLTPVHLEFCITKGFL